MGKITIKKKNEPDLEAKPKSRRVPQCQHVPEFSEGVQSLCRRRERLRPFLCVLKKASYKKITAIINLFLFPPFYCCLLFLLFSLRGWCRLQWLSLFLLLFLASIVWISIIKGTQEGTMNSVIFFCTVLPVFWKNVSYLVIAYLLQIGNLFLLRGLWIFSWFQLFNIAIPYVSIIKNTTVFLLLCLSTVAKSSNLTSQEFFSLSTKITHPQRKQKRKIFKS